MYLLGYVKCFACVEAMFLCTCILSLHVKLASKTLWKMRFINFVFKSCWPDSNYVIKRKKDVLLLVLFLKHVFIIIKLGIFNFC